MAELKILQIASGREINGAVVYCQTLCRELAARGHRVTQMCRPGSWLTTQPALEFSRKESSLKRFPPSEIRALAKWIRSEGFDLIHTHMSRAHTLGILARWQADIPVIATAHNQYFQLHWRLNDFVIANSQSTADFHSRVNRVPKHKIKPIFCMIDLDRFLSAGPQQGQFVRGEMRLKRDAFVIGIVGDIITRKGQLDAIQAMPEIIRHIPQARMVFVGRFHRREPYVKRMRHFQLKHQLYRRCKWLGLRPNIQDHLAGFNVCLVPSREEPMGMVAAEAQAVGTPVIATHVGGLPEIVHHETTGLIVPPGDHQAMAQAVIRLYQDQDLSRRLAAQAKLTVQEQFSPARLTAAVEGVYREVLQAFSRRRVG